MDVLVFDLFADLGHFKVPYTTTSPLTLPVPSKTAVYGIIAAVIGLDKDDYLHHFQEGECVIAVGIKRPIKKTHISENLINTKNVSKSHMFARMNSRRAAPHSPTRIEFLKDAGYRLYFHHRSEDILNRLDEKLVNHKSVYTISFGISECLANFTYVGSFKAENRQGNGSFVEFASILPLASIPSTEEIDLQEGYYIRAHIPLEMTPDRELIKTAEFLVEANGKTIKARVSPYQRIAPLGENVVFF